MTTAEPDEAERQGLPDDVYTPLREGRMILPGVQTPMFHRPAWSIVAGAAAMSLFATLWFIVPSLARAHRTPAEARAAGA